MTGTCFYALPSHIPVLTEGQVASMEDLAVDILLHDAIPVKPLISFVAGCGPSGSAGLVIIPDEHAVFLVLGNLWIVHQDLVEMLNTTDTYRIGDECRVDGTFQDIEGLVETDEVDVVSFPADILQVQVAHRVVLVDCAGIELCPLPAEMIERHDDTVPVLVADRLSSFRVDNQVAVGIPVKELVSFEAHIPLLENLRADPSRLANIQAGACQRMVCRNGYQFPIDKRGIRRKRGPVILDFILAFPLAWHRTKRGIDELGVSLRFCLFQIRRKRHGTRTLEADVLPGILVNPRFPLVREAHVTTYRAYELVMVRTLFQVLCAIQFMNDLVIDTCGYFRIIDRHEANSTKNGTVLERCRFELDKH